MNRLLTVTSWSHDLPVLEPTITYLLGIVDFGQVKKSDNNKKTATWPTLSNFFEAFNKKYRPEKEKKERQVLKTL